jgi:autotransporter passenger strand-loop-strand repeat protein
MARRRLEMEASASPAKIGIDRVARMRSRSHAVPMLQLFALTVMVIPADTVIKPIGAEGYAAALVGMFAFAAFLAATLLGIHDPLRHRHPVRAVLCLVWVCVLASYVLMDRGVRTGAEVMAADRLIMQFAVITGVALVAAECLNSLRDVRRVLRALTWGGAFCGVVAALQFWMSLDVTPPLRLLPGFSLNLDIPAIVGRAALNRVSGTSLTAIELGVVGGMLLPLAVHLAIHDTDRTAVKRWAPVVLTGLAIPTSVSRSGVISVLVAFSVLVVLMPPRQRLVALCGAPLAVTGVFMSAHGLIGTLTAFFQAGTNDDSVLARVYDYPEVERLVREKPWLGHGGGTYLPDYPMYILDNQYLKTAIELGLIGVVVIAAYFLVPLITALVARRRSSDPELRLLCAALAGAASAAAVCSLTFDSLSFPMFSNVYALVIGLIGASWRLAARSERGAPEPVSATVGSLSFPRFGDVYARAIGMVVAGGRLAVRAGHRGTGMVVAGGRLAVRAGHRVRAMVVAGARLAVRAGHRVSGVVMAGARLAVRAGHRVRAMVVAGARLAVRARQRVAELVWVVIGSVLLPTLRDVDARVRGMIGAGGRLAARAGRRAAERMTAIGSLTRAEGLRAAIVAASLVAAAIGVLLWGPWH